MNVQINDINAIYENEIKKNVRNIKKVYQFDLHKMEYIIDIINKLNNNNYDGGKYNIFLIYRPKIRIIMSQNIYDKLINHYVTRYILEPKLSKYLDIRNCATRKNKGTSYAIELFKKYLNVNKKNANVYVLKIDIKKYFYNIDHNVLKKMIIKDLSNEEYNLMCNIIDSTDKEYINKIINYLNKQNNLDLPLYKKGKGLPIGNLTSQFLAIFYLNRLQHFIIYDLKLKYMVNYMDDYVIIHNDKEYLNKCLKIIENKLNKEYLLEINKNKTYIRNIKYGVCFLGYNFKIINDKTIIKISKDVKQKLKINFKNLSNEQDFRKYFSKYMNYKFSYKYASQKEIDNLLHMYIG
jgi:RNA-directed DNA polymerase